MEQRLPLSLNNESLDIIVHSVLYEGVQSGARMLTDMTGTRFEAGLPHRVPSGIAASTLLVAAHRPVITSSLAFGGDFPGGVALLLADTDAARLARGLMKTHESPAGPMLISAVEEAANVLAHDALAPLARELRLALMMAPPRSNEAPYAKAWPSLMSELAPQPSDKSIVYTSALTGWNGECVAHFILVLGAEFEERYHSAKASTRIDVGLGELKLAQSPEVLRAASLGSCVAIILFDPLAKKGVMSHVVMPHATSPEKAAAMPGKFADSAVPALLKKMGGPAARLQAWMVGGANMFYGGSSPLLQVGQRNVERVRASLQQHGILAVTEDVGKNLGRTVELFTTTGEVWVRSGNVSGKLPAPRRSARFKLPDQGA